MEGFSAESAAAGASGGAESDALYVVLSGRLNAFVSAAGTPDAARALAVLASAAARDLPSAFQW
jgi:hypothetical protein